MRKLLLSRPEIPPEAQPYWQALKTLSRDRPILAGFGVAFPRPVPRETIRVEGERLGFSGESLDEFVEIVSAIDDRAVEIEMKRLRDEAKKKPPPNQRRPRHG